MLLTKTIATFLGLAVLLAGCSTTINVYEVEQPIVKEQIQEDVQEEVKAEVKEVRDSQILLTSCLLFVSLVYLGVAAGSK